MPYRPDHKAKTRARIIEAGRILFNRHGFHGVTIDMVMGQAGLTRGGFYSHFKTKDDLFAAAVSSFLQGRGAEWRDDAGIDLTNLSPQMAGQMIDSYLSGAHLHDTDGQCPMIALPSDVARVGGDVQSSYQTLLTAMVWLFERSLQGDPEARPKALSMAALCVGGMVLARTLPDAPLAEELRTAARNTALGIAKP
jgi:AcrR family transcriptional regulator